MSETITVASPPTTAEVATAMLAYLAAQSGVVTDINDGSQVRTIAESLGSVIEEQGAISSARAFQAILFGMYAAFGISQIQASAATTTLSFQTAPSGALPPTSQAVDIPAGTVVQTASGTQFQTSADASIALGGTAVNVIVQALLPGPGGNVPAGSINSITSGLTYPLYVVQSAAATGGGSAETPAQTLTRFTAKVLALGEGSPTSIANAVIGVNNVGTSEYVRYSTVYEPWADPTSGITTAQFAVYIDNGLGGASAGLLTAAKAVLNGNLTTSAPGNRPAGVPWTMNAVTPVDCSVSVTAVTINPANITALSAAISLAINAYFGSLGFGVAADVRQINAAVTNVCAGYVTSLSVTLLDSTSTSQTTITPTLIQRMLLTATALALT